MVGRRDARIWGVQLFVVLALVWFALNGFDGWTVGLAGAATGAVLGAWLVPAEPYRWRPLRLAAFFGSFVFESVRGGVDVARRALAPTLPIDPQFVRHESRLPPGQPLTLFVSALSLLPGTLSADVDDATGLVEIHLLTSDAMDSVVRLEGRIAWLFSLR